jgi:hypothetical protein
MKDMSESSTIKPARAKRTLPCLPKTSKPSNGVFLSPTCSPKSARKNCTNSPLATTGKERGKQSRLPVRKTQSLSECTAQKCNRNDKLRRQATIASSELSGNKYNNNGKDVKVSTNPVEINNGKTAKNSTTTNNQKNEMKINRIQELSNAANQSNSADTSILRILTKSESINSLDSVSGVTLEDERSCVTVAVRVRPFNQR